MLHAEGRTQADVVKAQVPVVHAVVAELGADVPHGDAWERVVLLCVAYAHHKGVRPMVLHHGKVGICKWGSECEGQLQRRISSAPCP